MVADGDGGCGSGLIGLIWVGVEAWRSRFIGADLGMCGGVEVWRSGLIGADLGMCGDGGWVVMVVVMVAVGL